MIGFHGSEPPTVAEAYDFSGIGTVVDVGGATGNMLAALLLREAVDLRTVADRASLMA